MNKWKWNNINDFRYINIPTWAEMGVTTAFTAKCGGFSQGDFTSLNMGLHVGDDVNKVIENRQLVMHSLNTSLDKMICAEQIHGVNIAVVDEEDSGKGAYIYDTALRGIDAMVTNVPQLYLTTFYADCYPLYFLDPVKRVIGIAHSGWKGTMGKIGVITAEIMGEKYGSRLEDLLVFIGPGIGKCCFAIDVELAAKVQNELGTLNNILSKDNAGIFWDLENTNQQMLIQKGIKKEHIMSCSLCSSCAEDDFFSYRRDKGKTGRMAAIIGLDY